MYPIDVNSTLWADKYKKFLNLDDPLDQLILDFAQKGELKVGFVKIKPKRKFNFKKYFSTFLKH